MKVYVKLVLFGQCELGHHDDCPAARLYVAADRVKHVPLCTCKCHETNIAHLLKYDEEDER